MPKKYRKRLIFLFILLPTILLNVSQAADKIQQSTQPQPIQAFQQPAQPSIIPAPPDINAKSYVLMDAYSGKIIASKNMNQKHPPASLTKMMTLYLASSAIQNGSLNLDDKVLVSKNAWRTGGSKMFIRANSKVSVKNLIQGIIVDSGNDACVALAEQIAGTQKSFTQMMNAQAKMLGMNNTHYTDCTGMPHPDHFSTAYDLAILARALITSFPKDYTWYKQKWFTYSGIRQPNRNRLLWRYTYADGIKTGHTKAAGFCLVSSAMKDGMRLISVVLGAPTDESRASDSMRLLNYGFRFYNTHLISQFGSIIAKPRVWYGEEKTIPASVDKDFYITVTRGQYKNLKMSIQMQKKLNAPIKKGQTVGEIIITLNKKPIASQNLIAMTDNPKGGIWRRSTDHVVHIFHSWFSAKNKPKNLS